MNQRGTNVALFAGGVLVLLLMLLGAVAIAGFLTTGSRSCDEMERAAADAASEVRRIDVVVGITGNSAEAMSEVEQFVARALASTAPDEVVVATVTVVNGDRSLVPPGDASACVGRRLLVAPSDADLASYEGASGEAKADVAAALTRQYNGQVDQVAAAAGATAQGAVAPESGDGGAFDLWPFIAASEGEVFALGTFSVGGDNCLTLDRPALLMESGSTAIGERVEGCVASADVALANSQFIYLFPTTTLNLTGTQREAQLAVINALCAHATPDGCG